VFWCVKASKLFSRSDVGSLGLVKIGSEANIASMPSVVTLSTHSSSTANLAMTSSTPSLLVKSNNAGTIPSITVTNLVTVITDARTLATEVIHFVSNHLTLLSILSWTMLRRHCQAVHS